MREISHSIHAEITVTFQMNNITSEEWLNGRYSGDLKACVQHILDEYGIDDNKDSQLYVIDVKRTNFKEETL